MINDIDILVIMGFCIVMKCLMAYSVNWWMLFRTLKTPSSTFGED